MPTSIRAYWAALRPDLKKHAAVGLAAGALATLAIGLLATHWAAWPAVLGTLAYPVPAGLVGAAAGAGIGWAKEYLWDARGHGTVDRADYLVTARWAAAGAAAGACVLALLGWAGWTG